MSSIEAQQSERIQLANALLDVMHHDSIQYPSASRILPEGATEEQRRTFEGTKRFTAAFLSPQQTRPVMAEAYAKAYDAAELRALVEFFGSPVGQKFLATRASIEKAQVDFIRSTMTAHAEDLVRMQTSPPEK